MFSRSRIVCVASYLISPISYNPPPPFVIYLSFTDGLFAPPLLDIFNISFHRFIIPPFYLYFKNRFVERDINNTLSPPGIPFFLLYPTIPFFLFLQTFRQFSLPTPFMFRTVIVTPPQIVPKNYPPQLFFPTKERPTPSSLFFIKTYKLLDIFHPPVCGDSPLSR